MLACYIDFISEDGNMFPVELRSKDDFGSDDQIFSEDFSAIILPKHLTDDLSRIESWSPLTSRCSFWHPWPRSIHSPILLPCSLRQH